MQNTVVSGLGKTPALGIQGERSKLCSGGSLMRGKVICGLGTSIALEFLTASRLRSLGLAVTLSALFIVSGSATMIATGQANIAGTAVVGTNFIIFSNNGTPNNFVVQLPDTGGFTGITGGSIQNLTTVTPVPFVTFFAPGGSIFFDLQGFNPGNGTGVCSGPGANVIGNSCTPVGSFFTLRQETASGVSVALNGFGISYTGTSISGSDPTTFGFTTQNLSPGTITGILAQVTAGGSPNSYSATFSASAVPEPVTMLMFGAGLLGVGLFGKFKKSF